MPLNRQQNSAAKRKAEQSETHNVPKVPTRPVKTLNTQFNEGEVRIQKYRDNRKNGGGIHNLITFKDADGVTRSAVPTTPEWDNETGELRLIVSAEVDGKTRDFYVTLTEKV